MTNSTKDAYRQVNVPAWMINLEQNRTFEKGTLATIGVALLGLATRVGITINNYDGHLPFIDKFARALSDNLLGAFQQPGSIAHSPELQIVEMLAGLAITTGLAYGGGKLSDNLGNKRKLKQMIDETRKKIIETGNITETLPISGHNVLVTPEGFNFVNNLAPIMEDSVIVTKTWNPYDAANKIKGEPVFPLFIKTEKLHDEDVYDKANISFARSLIIIPQAKDKLVFFDSEESTKHALMSLNSAQQSLPKDVVVPTLVFLQSESELISTHRLTARQYMEKMKLSDKKIEIKYIENLVVSDLIRKTDKRSIYIKTDLGNKNKLKLEARLSESGFKIAKKPGEAEIVFVHYSDDSNNLLETQLAAKKYPEKPVFSLLDTEVETEEVTKHGATPICIETIMKNAIADFLIEHPKQSLDIPINITLAERLALSFSRRISQILLRKNPKETKAILKMLDFAHLRIDNNYLFEKPSHFNYWHNLPGHNLLSFSPSTSTYQRVYREINKGNIEPKSAEEIATLYFN